MGFAERDEPIATQVPPCITEQGILYESIMSQQPLIPTTDLPARRIGMCAFFSVLAFMIYQLTLQTSYAPMSSMIVEQFGIKVAGSNLISAAFLISYALMQIPAGLFIDRYGARYMVVGAAVVMGIAALLFGASTNITWAIAARMMMGCAAAFAFPALGMVSRRGLPAHLFPIMMGIADTGLGVGGMIGNIGGAQMLKVMSWQSVMQFGALSMLPIAILLMTTLRGKWFAGSVAVAHSVGVTKALSLRALIGMRDVRLAAVIYAGGLGLLFGFGSVWNYRLAMAWDYSADQAAQMNAAFYCGVAVGAPLFGWLGFRFGALRPLRWGLWLSLIALLFWIFEPSATPILDFTSIALIGFGISSTVLAFEIGCRALPSSCIASAVALINFAGVICGALLQVIPTSIERRMNSTHLIEMQLANSIFILVIIAALVACGRVRRSDATRSNA